MIVVAVIVIAVIGGTRSCPVVSNMLMHSCTAIFLAAIIQISAAQPLRPTQAELRASLCGSGEAGTWNVTERAFYWERQLRPSIRALLRNRKCNGARGILAMIGVPADIRYILQTAPPPSKEPWESRWAYGVASALLEPRTEQEWRFLRACALNEYDDRWVDAGAIQTLKLIASPRSLQVLGEAQQRNSYRKISTSRAVDYVRSAPPKLAGQNLAELAERIAKAVGIGHWAGNGNPRLNQSGDKALINFEYDAAEDSLSYTATFHHVDGLWKLRGVRETTQKFSSPRIAIPPTRSVLPPPPELPSTRFSIPSATYDVLRLLPTPKPPNGTTRLPVRK